MANDSLEPLVDHSYTALENGNKDLNKNQRWLQKAEEDSVTIESLLSQGHIEWSRIGKAALMESKKLWILSGPSIIIMIFNYMLSVISQMFAGHLGELELAGASIANVGIQGLAYGIMESGGSATTTKAVSRHVGPNMTRLLIAGSQAGSLIGMSGNTIKKIRKDSGASVQVMPQNLLPSCASASETDRLVQISGELSQVLNALDHIGSTLRENPPKEVISMRPTYYEAPSAANRLMIFPRSVLPRYTMQSGNFGSSHSRAAGKADHGVSTISGASAAFPRVTVEKTIPSDVVGGLIGIGGSNISKVRSLSGATVKITGNKDFETRTIYFEGTAEQVAIAQNLVNSFINVQQQTR